MKTDEQGYIYFDTPYEAKDYVNGGYCLKEGKRYYPLGEYSTSVFNKIK